MNPGQEHTNKLSHELANRQLSLVVIETGLLVIIALIALLGNTCVLYVFYKMPSLRRPVTSYYIITLAISDILMDTFGIQANLSGRLLDQLTLYFKERQLLLVIDNFDHLIRTPKKPALAGFFVGV